MTPFAHRSPQEQAALLEQLARSAVARWPLDCVKLEPIKMRENAVYAVHTADGNRVALRIHRLGYHSNESLLSEIVWTRALAQHGVEVPHRLQSRAGNGFELVEAPGMDGARQVDVFAWIQGHHLGAGEYSDPQGAWVERSYDALGEVAARMHNHSCAWRPPAGFVRHAWDAAGLMGERPLWGPFWELSALTPPQRAFFQEVRRRLRDDLESYGTSPDRYGLIHADLVTENLLLDGSGLRVIDFDDAGFGWYLFELATSLYFLRESPIYARARDALITGYRRHRALSEDDLKRLPMFTAARGTTYLGWIHTRQGEGATQGRAEGLIARATAAAMEYLNQ